MSTQAVPSLWRVYITATICTFFAVAYGLSGAELAPFVFLVASYATPVSAVLWLQRDARIQGITTVYDWGLFAFVAWPVMIPWYAIKTRGLGAGLPLAAFLLLPVLAPLLTFALVTVTQRR